MQIMKMDAEYIIMAFDRVVTFQMKDENYKAHRDGSALMILGSQMDVLYLRSQTSSEYRVSQCPVMKQMISSGLPEASWWYGARPHRLIW